MQRRTNGPELKRQKKKPASREKLRGCCLICCSLSSRCSFFFFGFPNLKPSDIQRTSCFPLKTQEFSDVGARLESLSLCNVAETLGTAPKCPPLKNALPEFPSRLVLFLLFLPFCTVPVRNIEADSDEHWLFSPPFSTAEADTFVAPTAQSLKSKDKKTADQRSRAPKDGGF